MIDNFSERYETPPAFWRCFSLPDIAYAEAAGRSPGGHIMIHGLPNGWGFLGPLHLAWDWTDGCIAVTDAQMREIWSRVPNGTPIEILP